MMAVQHVDDPWGLLQYELPPTCQHVTCWGAYAGPDLPTVEELEALAVSERQVTKGTDVMTMLAEPAPRAVDTMARYRAVVRQEDQIRQEAVAEEARQKEELDGARRQHEEQVYRDLLAEIMGPELWAQGWTVERCTDRKQTWLYPTFLPEDVPAFGFTARLMTAADDPSCALELNFGPGLRDSFVIRRGKPREVIERAIGRALIEVVDLARAERAWQEHHERKTLLIDVTLDQMEEQERSRLQAELSTIQQQFGWPADFERVVSECWWYGQDGALLDHGYTLDPTEWPADREFVLRDRTERRSWIGGAVKVVVEACRSVDDLPPALVERVVREHYVRVQEVDEDGVQRNFHQRQVREEILVPCLGLRRAVGAPTLNEAPVPEDSMPVDEEFGGRLVTARLLPDLTLQFPPPERVMEQGAA